MQPKTYILRKNLPDAKKGTKFFLQDGKYFYKTITEGEAWYEPQYVENNPKFFEFIDTRVKTLSKEESQETYTRILEGIIEKYGDTSDSTIDNIKYLNKKYGTGPESLFSLFLSGEIKPPSFPNKPWFFASELDPKFRPYLEAVENERLTKEYNSFLDSVLKEALDETRKPDFIWNTVILGKMYSIFDLRRAFFAGRDSTMGNPMPEVAFEAWFKENYPKQ